MGSRSFPSAAVPAISISIAAVLILSPLTARRAGAVPQLFRRGDANADGRVDLADGIRILDVLFRAAAAAPWQAHLAAGDIDGDGRTDLVVASRSGRSVTILLGIRD